MIFDSHFHLDTETPSSLDSIIGGCLVSRTPDQNQRCIDTAGQLGVNCAIYADSDRQNSSEVSKWLERGRVCVYDHIELLDCFEPSVQHPVWEAADLVGVPIILHLNHHDDRTTPARVVENCLNYVSEHFPKLRVVIAHMGGENCRTVLNHARMNPNIFFEISTLWQTATRMSMASPTDALRLVLEQVGAQRVLFGSDLTFTGNRCHSVEFRAVCDLVDGEDRERVLLRNALELFEGSIQ
jgi:predicted TIM-barrel fold metal-dependent hydrolase